MQKLPGDVGRCVEEILLRALAVETNGHKVTLVLLHHHLEVLVGEMLLVLKAGVHEHAFDELGDAVVGQRVGFCDFDQRTQHFRELSFVNHAVAVVVAHVENDAQFVVGLAS